MTNQEKPPRVEIAFQQELDAAASSGRVPGVVAIAADRAGIVFQGAAGRRDLGAGAAMTVDTVVWIASMTKAITTVAAMRLVEQGRLALDAPLGHIAPHLGRVQVLDGFDEGGAPRLRPPARPVTLRHLLTHTAGFAYDTWCAEMGNYAAATGLPSARAGFLAGLEAPLMFDPGDRWQYGLNIEWTGRIIEAVEGAPLDAVLADRIFRPLGMADTGFVPTAAMRARLARVHRRLADGTLTPIETNLPTKPEFWSGGGHLYSTGPDYTRFLRMILRGGELDGARILRAETIADMARNQIGDVAVTGLRTVVPEASRDIEMFPGMLKKWGLGFLINTEDGPDGRAAGSLAWAGLGNTYYWIDPARGVAGLLLTQVLPFGDPDVLALFASFERAAYASRR